MSTVVDIKDAPKWAYEARILSALYKDISNLERTRREFGANTILLYCCPEITNTWCPSGTWEQVEEFIQSAHKNDLRVICYYDTTLTEESFYQGHEGWTQRNERNEPQHYQPNHVKPHRYAYCYNSPWSERVQEIARHYVSVGADGVFLDNPCYYVFTGKSCFCTYCQQQFRQYTGKNLFSISDQERTEWLKKSIQNHIQRVYKAMISVGHDRSLVITANTIGNAPTRCLATLGPYENVLFREISPGNQNIVTALEQERSSFLEKPLWVILTEHSGSKGWAMDVEVAARELDEILHSIFAINACPMVWSTIPSQDPDKPGFTNVSIYTNSHLANVVKKHFLK